MEWGDYPELPKWAKCNHNGPCKWLAGGYQGNRYSASASRNNQSCPHLEFDPVELIWGL